jgi:protein phosphatase methylesterase 1
MSSLQRELKKPKLANLKPPLAPPQEHEEDAGETSSASSMSSTGTIVPNNPFQVPPHQSSAYPPWPTFFDQELYFDTELDNGSRAKYHVYLTPPASPNDVLFVLHHGAGSSPLSFALCVAELRTLLPKAGILAISARDHGSVVYTSSGTIDTSMSLDALAADLERMITLTNTHLKLATCPRLLLVGHSLGGAVVTHTAHRRALGTRLIGYVVIDVVEGSALEALRHMKAYLTLRPATFSSLDDAVEWHIASRTLRNRESARASVPGIVVPMMESGWWRWRTDLSRTEEYWGEWFGGMSGKFLGSRGAKMLALAGTDRLDKELLVGQMQGEYSLLLDGRN